MFNNLNNSSSESEIEDDKYLNVEEESEEEKEQPSQTKPKISIYTKPSDNKEGAKHSKFISAIQNSTKEGSPKGSREKKLEKTLQEKYGIGYKLLKQAGYKIGGGLGANEQGITDPVEITKRRKGVGIAGNAEVEVIQESKILLGKKREPTTKDELSNQYEKFEEMINEFREGIRNEEKVLKIIANAKEKKIASDNEKTFLLQQTKKKICDYLLKYFSNESNKILYEKMSTTNDDNNNHIDDWKKRDELNNELRVSKSKYILLSGSSLEEVETFADNYSELLTKYKNIIIKFEYDKLLLFCIKEIIKSVNAQLTTAKAYLNDEISNKIISISEKVHEMLRSIYDEKLNNHYDNTHMFSSAKVERNHEEISFPYENSTKYYCSFMYEILIKKYAVIIKTQWNVIEYEKMVSFLLLYKPVLPEFLLSYISDTIASKITQHLELNYSFSPSKVTNIHKWIHPWFEVLKLSSSQAIMKVVEEKIKEGLFDWDLKNEDALTQMIQMLSPWRIILDKFFKEELEKKFFIPKCTYIIEKFEINPSNQKINDFFCVMKLYNSGLINAEDTTSIFIKKFFPKFFKVLDHWLKKGENSKKKMNEVQSWYKGWKELFGKELLERTEIKNEFKDALILIYNYTKTNSS